MATKKNTDTNENHFGAYTQLMEEQMGRFEASLAELGQRNDQALEAANAAIGEWAKLAQDAATASHQMSTEWLKAVSGSTRRANEMMSAVAGR